MTRVFRIAVAMIIFISVEIMAADQLELDATAIQSTRELPKILYIVPWKSARLDSLSNGVGGNSFDTEWEVLDQDVFRRQVEYYETLYGAGE